jgi:hypothetical protein
MSRDSKEKRKVKELQEKDAKKREAKKKKYQETRNETRELRTQPATG